MTPASKDLSVQSESTSAALRHSSLKRVALLEDILSDLRFAANCAVGSKLHGTPSPTLRLFSKDEIENIQNARRVLTPGSSDLSAVLANDSVILDQDVIRSALSSIIEATMFISSHCLITEPVKRARGRQTAQSAHKQNAGNAQNRRKIVIEYFSTLSADKRTLAEANRKLGERKERVISAKTLGRYLANSELDGQHDMLAASRDRLP